MGSYYTALEEEGYDAVGSLILLSAEEIDELCTVIKMKPGHKKRFPVVIAEVRKTAESAKEREEKKERIENELADTDPKSRHFSFTMPPGKNHFAFLSHKKTNSKLGGNTETLALRVRALLFLVLLCSHKPCSHAGQRSYGRYLGLAVVLRCGQFEADYK